MNEHNQRAFFRVYLYTAPVVVETTVWEESRKKADVTRQEGTILNISGNGIAVVLPQPLAPEGEHSVSFVLEEKSFTFRIALVREQRRDKREYVYAARFVDVSEKEASLLSSLLFRMDAKSRK